jgi:quercetin dioxygenase-like cupin family protein
MVTRLLKSTGLAIVIGALSCAATYAQAPAAPAGPPATPAGQTPAAPGRGIPPTTGVGSVGDPDPGVHYIVVLENPSVRVLQVTLQPGAVRRDHVHNDVTFHMLVPITGSLEVTEASAAAPTGRETIVTLPGQAYYMVKGQPHGFTNRTAAAVQVIEVFVRGEVPAPWPVPFVPPPPSAVPAAPGAPRTP